MKLSDPASNTCHSIEIIIDHRETNQEIRNILKEEKNVRLIIRDLKYGDFLINDSLIIERKTVPDFIASIKDGRIFKQAAKISSSFKLSLIIIEGSTGYFKFSKIKREALQGALLTLTLKFQIPVLRSVSANDTVKLIIMASRQVFGFNKKDRVFPLRKQGNSRNTKWRDQLSVLQGFPGIGPTKGILMMEHFGSLKNIFNAGISDLQKTSGIGDHLAKDLFRILNEEKIL